MWRLLYLHRYKLLTSANPTHSSTKHCSSSSAFGRDLSVTHRTLARLLTTAPLLSLRTRQTHQVCKDLQYTGAMGHPGGSEKDIPNRLSLVLPRIANIDDIYGQMLRGRIKDGSFDAEVMKACAVFPHAYNRQYWRQIWIGNVRPVCPDKALRSGFISPLLFS